MVFLIQNIGYAESFVAKTNIQNATGFECYIHSVYFTVMVSTTVGFGDISGQNVVERIASIIMEIFGTMMYSYGATSLIILFRIVYNEEVMINFYI